MFDLTSYTPLNVEQKRLKAPGVTTQFFPKTKCNKIKQINPINYLFVTKTNNCATAAINLCVSI